MIPFNPNNPTHEEKVLIWCLLNLKPLEGLFSVSDDALKVQGKMLRDGFMPTRDEAIRALMKLQAALLVSMDVEGKA